MRKTLVFGRHSEISRKPFGLLEIVENVSKTKRRKNTAQLYSAYLKYFVFHGGCLFQVDRSFQMGTYSGWGLHLRVSVYSRWGLHLRVGVYSRWGLHLRVGAYLRWGLHLRVGAYSRWGLHLRVGVYSRWGLHLRVGAYLRLGLHLRVGAYSNKFGIPSVTNCWTRIDSHTR